MMKSDRRFNYSLVDSENSARAKDGAATIIHEPKIYRYPIKTTALVLVAAISVFIFLFAGFQLGSNLYFARNYHNCSSPTIRREWRSLSWVEKLNYIEAVQCLRGLPSRLGLNHSLYADFPYVHENVGNYCEKISLVSDVQIH